MLTLAEAGRYVPHVIWVLPFIAILLAIAIFPLLRRTHHWWEENRSKLIVALLLAAVTLLYYGFREQGVKVHHAEPAATETAAAATGDHETPAAPPVTAEPSEPATPETPTTATAPHAPNEMSAITPEQMAQAAEATAAEGHDEHAAGAHVEHRTPRGFATVWAVIQHSVLQEYIPFMVLLFSLYVIAGGIVVRGDLEATPLTNTMIIGTGGLLASFIGTTGAAMVLIRFLLKTNSERKYQAHTVIFFIFVVANIGGTLLPIGDPPLFLGYLRGVPFFWTMHLWSYWLSMLVAVLTVYFIWDTILHRKESPAALKRDETQIERLHAAGLINVIWLLGVVAAVALLDPSKTVPGTNWKPVVHFGSYEFVYIREVAQLTMALLSWWTTSLVLRKENQFNFVAIGEVACLFIGIFITMQVPIEILQAKGGELGLHAPWHFFWATGILSSFLDNAPTYVVYFETAGALHVGDMAVMAPVQTADGTIGIPLLIAISCGAVFMGANTYIGNGPNFMVKAIAEQSGVKMPSFFGYMLYSGAVLIPLFIILTLVFFR